MTDTFTVEINWIRHGYSCANVARDKGVWASLNKGNYAPDAALTNYGITQSLELNKELSKSDISRYDAVLASELRRAIETAMYSFKGYSKPVYVVPYISEARNFFAKLLGVDKDNTATDINVIKDEVKDISATETGLPEVSFKMLEDLRPKNETSSPDIKNFFNLVLPEMVRIVRNRDGKYDKKDFKIAVVSHHHFIENHLNKDQKLSIKKYKNTEMWREKVEFTYDSKTKKYAPRYLELNDCKEKCAETKEKSDTCSKDKTGHSLSCQKYPGMSEPNKDALKADTALIQRCDIKHADFLKKLGKKKGGSYDFQSLEDFYHYKMLKYQHKCEKLETELKELKRG